MGLGWAQALCAGERPVHVSRRMVGSCCGGVEDEMRGVERSQDRHVKRDASHVTWLGLCSVVPASVNNRMQVCSFPVSESAGHPGHMWVP